MQDSRQQSQIEECFEVYPKNIKKKILKRRRNDKKQEQARILMLEAFEEFERNPEKYGDSFKIIVPKKTWTSINAEKAQEIALQLKGHMIDWVEQALEWAQRIYNGESWEDICNKPDKSKYCRIVIWKDGNIRIVGGSENSKYSMTDVCDYDFDFNNEFKDVIPLVASQIETV